MKTNILNYINKLQGYKTAIKNLHWSSKHMSEHKLLDEIADSVANNQDEIAEMCQGLYGKIKLNELKPKRYKITNSKKMLFDLLKDTKSFYSSIKGRELTGVRSVVESFIGEINKFVYLMDMCIKEDIKRNLKTNINESLKINEKDLRESIQLAIKRTLKEDFNNQPVQKFMDELDAFEEKSLTIAQDTIDEFKKQLFNIKKIIPQVLEKIKNLGGGEDVFFEKDPLLMYVELPFINGYDSDEEYFSINEKFKSIEYEFKNDYPISVEVDDEPKNGKYYVCVEFFDYIPQLTVEIN